MCYILRIYFSASFIYLAFLTDNLNFYSKSSYNDLSIYENFYFNTIQFHGVCNRIAAVYYINEVARISKISDQTRDISIQIFDKFMALSVIDPANHVDNIFLSKTAATALIIASKFHECNHSLLLKMTSFDMFSNELVAFECQVLSKIEFSINPSITPSLFIEYFISLCQYDYDEVTIRKLYISSANLLTEFWGDPASLLFSPGTLAFCIVFLSFRLHLIDCTPWLRCVPECCSSSFIPSGSNYINTSFYNVGKCKQVLQVYLPELEIPTPVSPVGVTDGSFSPACVRSSSVNGDCSSNNGRQSNIKTSDKISAQNDSALLSFDISAIEADSKTENSSQVGDAGANYMFHTISHV